MRLSIEACNEANDAALANVNGGPLRIYQSTGTRPVDADAAANGTMLVELTLNATAFGASANRTATANAIASGVAVANGDPDYARAFKTGGTVGVGDFSVACKKDVTLVDAGDLVQQTAHGRANGTAVRFGGTLTGTGLSAGVTYYVISSNANDHQVSATLGGTAVVITGAGSGVKCWRDAEIVLDPSTIASGSTISISSLTSTAPVGS